MSDHVPEIPPERDPPQVPDDPSRPFVDPTNPPFEPVRKINLPPDSPSPGVEVPETQV